jgi:peptidoglycan/LPS O-acetylase OafA/YrhL
MTTRDNKRLDNLDVVCGIAVLAICIELIFGYLILKNYVFNLIQPYLKFILANSINWRRLGVVLIILISGFIIPNSLKPGTKLNEFIVSRTFRLHLTY